MGKSQYSRPTDLTLYALARSLARVAHFGQKRKGNGEPYFAHVARVAQSVEDGTGSTRAAIVALLHDTLEDTTVTEEALLAIGFSTRIVHDVLALTRRPDEEYMHYIGRLIEYGSDDALRVKLADLTDNLRDIDTLPRPVELIASLRTRYLKALHYVGDALTSRSAADHAFDQLVA
jgi:(p)ppGpp synthase/HD superfamily hydrolase